MNIELDISFMPPKTLKVFETLSKQNFISNFTLVGGTALSVQLKHRRSEDLDFIFDGDELSINTIKRNISRLFPNYRIIKQDYNWQIDFVADQVKLTFFTSGAVVIPFNIKKYAFRYDKINICKASVIASLKMATIAQRNTIRDYYDLYFLAKYFMPLYEIINQTKRLIPNLSPITYTETLVYTKDIEEADVSNHLSPIEIITKEQMAGFFIDELRKIKQKI